MKTTNLERSLCMMVCFYYLAEKAIAPATPIFSQVLFGFLAVVALSIQVMVFISHFWKGR